MGEDAVDAGSLRTWVVSVVLFCCGLAGAQTPVKVLDVLRVKVDGDAANAVVTLKPGKVMEVRCDVVIAGAGMGGTSAALAATQKGLHVCMTEPTMWVGGQTTSQGVSAFDDNQYIDTTGGTASYMDLSRRLREHYAVLRRDTALSVSAAIAAKGPMSNPGGCWVSRLCFEPAPAEKILAAMLQPAMAAGRLQLWLHTVPVSVERDGRVLRSVLVYDLGRSQWIRLKASYFVDASEMGDLLPMTGLSYRMGAEARAETHERDAPVVADRRAAQSFTYTFVLDNPAHPAGVAAMTPKPAGYAGMEHQFTMVVDYGKGKLLTYGFFEARAGLPGSFWVYRRSVEAAKFRDGAFDGDRAMINWSSNDYCDANLLGTDPLLQATALQNGKRLSAGFAWWMQHEVPRDDGSGKGYPQLTVMKDAMGTEDGLSQHPYIRESRRIVPKRTIVEEDLAVEFQKGSRAEAYPDSVGIGWYPIDIHSCDRKDLVLASKPYQVPLGALIARDLDNLMAASKDIGTTHITNGAYRLHPTEWAVGEAVGMTMAMAIGEHRTPAQIDEDAKAIERLQRMLVSDGHPVVWYDDVPVGSGDFAGMQMAGAQGWLPLDAASLHGGVRDGVTGGEVAAALEGRGGVDAAGLTRLRAMSVVQWRDLTALGLTASESGDEVVTRGSFANWMLRRAR